MRKREPNVTMCFVLRMIEGGYGASEQRLSRCNDLQRLYESGGVETVFFEEKWSRNVCHTAMTSCLWGFLMRRDAWFSCIAGLEKIRCTEFQEDLLRSRDALFGASVMEKYIVQWKVAQRVMESFTWCNGKFRSGQWKVYNYTREEHFPCRKMCYT